MVAFIKSQALYLLRVWGDTVAIALGAATVLVPIHLAFKHFTGEGLPLWFMLGIVFVAAIEHGKGDK